MLAPDSFEKLLELDLHTPICGISMDQLFKPKDLQLFQMELLEKALTFANRKEKNQYE